MTNRLFFVASLFAFAGCATSGMEATVQHYTDLHGAQKSEFFVPGTYKYVRVGLEASADARSTAGGTERLGQIAMDRLVKKAALGPNQILVDMTVERGMAIKKKGLKSDSLHVVTLHGDVIELDNAPSPSLEPDWGDPLGDPLGWRTEDKPAQKVKRRGPGILE